MFKPRTVFIIGAGASAEVGLPSGEKIIAIIQESLRQGTYPGRKPPHQPDFPSVFNFLSTGDSSKYKLYREAAQKIIDGASLGVSIDNFLHTHRENKYIQIVGKLAIANTILHAERNSSIGPDPAKKVYPSQAGATWFGKFVKKLFEGRTKDKLPGIFDGIEIVCFNYDRCIEHFLRHAVVSYFFVNMEEAEEIVSNLRIHRPYGTVGDLSVIKPNGGGKSSGKGLGFGNQFDENQLIEASKQIQIFTERTQNDNALNAIQDCMTRAARVVFLGFGYISQNMSLLQTEAIGPNRRPIIRGTAHGISESDRKIIESKMWEIYRAPEGVREGSVRFDIQLDDLTCANFFDQRWHELSQ